MNGISSSCFTNSFGWRNYASTRGSDFSQEIYDMALEQAENRRERNSTKMDKAA